MSLQIEVIKRPTTIDHSLSVKSWYLYNGTAVWHMLAAPCKTKPVARPELNLMRIKIKKQRTATHILWSRWFTVFLCKLHVSNNLKELCFCVTGFAFCVANCDSLLNLYIAVLLKHKDMTFKKKKLSGMACSYL